MWRATRNPHKEKKKCHLFVDSVFALELFAQLVLACGVLEHTVNCQRLGVRLRSDNDEDCFGQLSVVVKAVMAEINSNVTVVVRRRLQLW